MGYGADARTLALAAIFQGGGGARAHYDIRPLAVAIAALDGPQSVADLGVVLGLPQATTSTWLELARGLGWVRTDVDPADARRRLVVLTPRGHRRLDVFCGRREKPVSGDRHEGVAVQEPASRVDEKLRVKRETSAEGRRHEADAPAPALNQHRGSVT